MNKEIKHDFFNKFPSGVKVHHKNGKIYTIINIPSDNVLLHSSRESFYLYQCDEDSIVYARAKSEFESGSYTEINRPERKVSIQKKGSGWIAGMFIGLECVQDFKPFPSKDKCLQEARFFFSCSDFDVVFPKITKMQVTMGKK